MCALDLSPHQLTWASDLVLPGKLVTWTSSSILKNFSQSADSQEQQASRHSANLHPSLDPLNNHRKGGSELIG
ncbi:hypothetical protein PGT21_017976 [Puccinia graminis f. sp. tritici]|uniref:Uncharacterized protein n=1 Tax=Puccinia graminis f. sp. tritici TaxID=56615 RepID=A0A5B0SI19_PUCGR|nr:hypothetical protein PGT21_017976 [Puccinia graminis f. sp. tritici]KAA1136144.1 hypothetical protein PGTUg99_033499 [Puccinia graminis f. sp. tritici]